MNKPIVAIVGRPNVGKSTLFNALAGQMISIVKDTPGVTRDRIYADIDWLNHQFTLIDTGGIEPDSSDIILSQMREQAQIAIDTADVIIFMTDVKQGLIDADAKVADMLRRSRKPVILVVNKVDNYNKMMADVFEFYNLGIGEPIAISAAQRSGLGDVLDKVTATDIEEYLDYIQFYIDSDGKEHTNKECGIKRKLGCLRTLYKFFYKKEKISTNPASIVDMPKIHEKEIVRLDADEVGNLLDEVETGDNLTDNQKYFHEKTNIRYVANFK